MFETPTLDTLAAYNINVALPAIVLLVGAMVLLLVDLFLPEERRVIWTPALALACVTIGAVLTLGNYTPTNPDSFAGMFVADAFTSFLNLTVLGCAFISILLTTDYLRREAEAGRRQDFDRYLGAVPDVEPAESDRLEP